MKKVKRPVCIILTVLILVTSPIAAYNQAQAAEIVGTMELLQALLEMFGVSVGLGTQSDYFSQESFNDFAAAVSNGHVYHMDKYGDVDFSDDASVQEWLEWANGIDDYITASGWSPMDKYDAAIKSGAVLLDCASYKITGTSATTAMHGYIDDLVSLFGVSGDGMISLDARDAYSFFSGAGDNDDDDDEEAKKKRYKTRFAYFAGLTGAMILSMGDKLTELVGLKHPETSDFSEYDAAFEDTYFDGTYTMNADGMYSYYASTSSLASCPDGKKRNSSMHLLYSYKVVGVLFSGSCFFYCLRDGSSSLSNVRFNYVDEYMYNMYSGNNSISSPFAVNFPIYLDNKSALAALRADDFSNAENIVENPYIHYKENAPSTAARLPKRLESWIMSPEYLQKLPSMVKPVFDAADSSAGKTDSIDAIEDAINEIAPADTEVVDPPVTEDPADYSGILGKILAAINKIISLLNPATYVAAFAKKFMTADSLSELLNSLPELFAKAYVSALVLPVSSVIDAIDAIPESLVTGLALPDVIKGAIASVFPRVDEVEAAIIGFPDIIAGALSGIVIEAPEIQIPEFTIPDVISIAKLDISELSVPAMVNPVIDLTLNPSYDITVANDYTGLTDIISSAVDGVLTDLFVPNEALAMEKVAEMEAYFKFKDSIITGVIDLKTMLYGITPSPILKIPIGKPTSKYYNYGTGNYIIIDVSWYAPYKQLGDKIILAIAWALFLWHMFIKLPGIISGTEGSIVSMDKSYQRYEIIQKSKKR